MGVSTPIIDSGIKRFSWEILRTILTLLGALPPPLWHPRIAIVLYYLVNFESGQYR